MNDDTRLINALLDVLQPTDVQLSPDGQQAVFVLGTNNKPDKDSPARKALHSVEIASGKTRLLTGSPQATNDNPRWSPDGQRLIFTSNREDQAEKQLYLLDMEGGEAQALTDLRGVVDLPLWLPDGQSVAFVYSGTLDKDKTPPADPVVVDAEPRFNRLWLLDIESQSLRPVTSDSIHVHEYALSHDGTQAALIASTHPNPMQGWYSAQLYVTNLASGATQQLCTMPNQIGRPSWSPDGIQVAFVTGVLSDEGNVAGEVYRVPAAGGTAQCLTPGLDHSVTWIDWRAEGILYGGRHTDCGVLGWIDPQNGSIRPITSGRYSINGFGGQAISPAGMAYAAIRSSFDEPTNIYIGSLTGGEMTQCTHLPLDNAALPPLRVEHIHWTSPDGNIVYGFLVYPPDYQAGQRYPLFCNVHGGPSWSYVPHYISAWPRLFAARGCLVLLPDPRGSWGRGHAYQAANVGDLGGGDWRDINAGVDCLIEQGLVDAERMAVGGWSYGGYLTCWAVTQTERFRCAIAGASITNYESNYGVVNNREWQSTMFGSVVYDDFDLHRERSPIAHVQKVTTSLLLVHGLEDDVAPPQQSIEYYTALRYYDRVTQLALYPREPHGFREREHQRDLYARMLAWVDQYLFS